MKISEILSEDFQFLVVKFSIYLNRCVFVMTALLVRFQESCVQLPTSFFCV